MFLKYKKGKNFKRFIVVFAIIFITIGFLVFCDISMLYPWQYQARRNRKAILEYVRNAYPKAIMIEEHYQTTKFNPTNKPHDVIWFELDGIKFYIAACGGRVDCDNDDGYPEARVTAQIDNIIKDGFLKPRGIKASPFYRFHDDYKKTYPYTGSLYVELRVQGITPQEVGWLYDFYIYWKKEGSFFREYRVDILVNEGDMTDWIIIENDSDFADENEFYSAFIKYPY